MENSTERTIEVILYDSVDCPAFAKDNVEDVRGSRYGRECFLNRGSWAGE